MQKKLNKISKDTNFFLKNFLKKQGSSELIPAIKYGLFPGGKKIRSKILIDIGSLLFIDYKMSFPPSPMLVPFLYVHTET